MFLRLGRRIKCTVHNHSKQPQLHSSLDLQKLEVLRQVLRGIHFQVYSVSLHG
jgi:hypothetical protein